MVTVNITPFMFLNLQMLIVEEVNEHSKRQVDLGDSEEIYNNKKFAYQ